MTEWKILGTIVLMGISFLCADLPIIFCSCWIIIPILGGIK